jgi:hypothetical protein
MSLNSVLSASVYTVNVLAAHNVLNAFLFSVCTYAHVRDLICVRASVCNGLIRNKLLKTRYTYLLRISSILIIQQFETRQMPKKSVFKYMSIIFN